MHAIYSSQQVCCLASKAMSGPTSPIQAGCLRFNVILITRNICGQRSCSVSWSRDSATAPLVQHDVCVISKCQTQTGSSSSKLLLCVSEFIYVWEPVDRQHFCICHIIMLTRNSRQICRWKQKKSFSAASRDNGNGCAALRLPCWLCVLRAISRMCRVCVCVRVCNSHLCWQILANCAMCSKFRVSLCN